MNIVFWLIAGAMVLLALLIILPPLRRKNTDFIEDDLDQRNIKIARDRLAELQANKASGGISQTQYEEQVTELELALSDDLAIEESTAKPAQKGRWLFYVLLVAIPLISTGLYWTLGDFQAINRINDPNQALANQGNPNQPSPETINKMVAKLAEKLKAEPNNLEGWFMLGRSYKVLEKYPEAVDAFSHAYQLAGDKPDVMLAYAEVLAFSKNGDWGGKAMELVLHALAKEPNNMTGLWFAAMAKAQQGDKPSAMDYLRKLDAVLPADSPDKQQVHDLITTAESRAGTDNPEKSTKPETATSSITITINVSLAEGLRQQVSQEDTLFIYAQAISGPKMPLAIVRKKVSDLPVSVSLTDADSMIPSMKLSSFEEVRLLARISKSGNPMPQPEDFIGTIEQASLDNNKPYSIVINANVK